MLSCFSATLEIMLSDGSLNYCCISFAYFILKKGRPRGSTQCHYTHITMDKYPFNYVPIFSVKRYVALLLLLCGGTRGVQKPADLQ